VGSKTVTLTGLFQGAYLLLASHDDATFDPVLTFDANGLESIKLTLADAYKSVRVRAVAGTVPGNAVTVTVAGILAPGENMFGVLATFPPGAGGSSTVVDLYSLFPPTGLESDINIMCAGGVTGAVVVEGSQDGSSFNPIGTFQAGSQQRSLLGGPPPNLEFSPLSTGDVVRYLRITLNGQVTSGLTLTIGGSIAGSSTGGILIPLLVSDFAQTYQGLGEVSIPGIGAFSAVLGFNNTLSPTPTQVAIVGSFNTIADSVSHSTVLGFSNNVSSPNSLVAGLGLTSGDSSCVLLGTGNAIGNSSQNAVVMGSNIDLDAHSQSVIAIGTFLRTHSVSGNCTSSILIGDALDVTDSLAVVLGNNDTVNVGVQNAILLGLGLATSSNNTLIGGAGSSIDVDCHDSTLLGFGNILGAHSSQAAIVGNGVVVGVASTNVAALGTATVGSSSPYAVAILGTVGSNASYSLAIWSTVGDPVSGTSCYENVCIGNTSSIVDGTIQAVLVGGGAGMGSIIDTSSNWSVAVGPGNRVANGCQSCVIVGKSSSIIESQDTITIGTFNRVDATATIAGQVTMVGYSNYLHADTHTATLMSIFGSNNDTTGLEGTVICGNNNALADGTSSVVVGIHNIISVGQSASECVLLGKDLTVATAHTVTIGVGGSNSGIRGIVMGYQASIGTLSPDGIAIGSGASVAANRAGSQAYGAGASASLPNQVVFGSIATPVLQFYAQSDAGAGGNAALFNFDYSIIVGNHDTNFQILYKNALGNIVIQQVKVDAVTGALTVPL
jgi:hypothetical protein